MLLDFMLERFGDSDGYGNHGFFVECRASDGFIDGEFARFAVVDALFGVFRPTFNYVIGEHGRLDARYPLSFPDLLWSVAE